MISLYRMFQIIFGIVVSVFILYFLIQYTGNYAGFQEDVQRVKILRNLKTTTESVYTYGNPVVFTDTSMYDFSSCYMSVVEPNPPEIRCDFGHIGPVFIPTLLSLGKSMVVVDSSEMNFGWHVMRWTIVMPRTKIIFNPMESSPHVWDLMKNITNMLPATDNLQEKVTFGFCDGNEIIEDICGGDCEKYGFLEVLETNRASANKCTARIPNGYTLITISSQCRMGFSDSGVCIVPPTQGTGMAYLYESGEDFVYKDYFDILALVLGGSRKDVFGKTAGERLYSYKNNIWKDRISIAAGIMKQRMLLVSGRYQASGEYMGCVPIYISLSGALGSIEATLEGDITNPSIARNLAIRLSEAKSLHSSLVNLGCEYYV
ncbi:hypothetical protein ACFLQO_00720 [Candidatus Aenigmatarchaeota archaeon]